MSHFYISHFGFSPTAELPKGGMHGVGVFPKLARLKGSKTCQVESFLTKQMPHLFRQSMRVTVCVRLLMRIDYLGWLDSICLQIGIKI